MDEYTQTEHRKEGREGGREEERSRFSNSMNGQPPFFLAFSSPRKSGVLRFTFAPRLSAVPRQGPTWRLVQLNLITEAATSARYGLCQFYNGRNPLELISDEEINLLTGQIYGIQVTIDPLSTQLIKTFLAWPSTLCTLKQIISNKQVLWGPKENVNL